MTNKFFTLWIPVAVATTAILFVTYAVVQQTYRTTANDPQIELTHNAVTALSGGLDPSVIVLSLPKTDMINSESLFVMVYSDTGMLRGTSATIGNSTTTPPTPPQGMFDYVRKNGQLRETWQTTNGRRYATVIDRYSGKTGSGFFLAARSLNETENRIGTMGKMIILGWLACLLAEAAAVWLSIKFFWYTEAH